MDAQRIVIRRARIDGVPVEVDYADLFVVVREGETDPGPTDWESQLRTPDTTALRPARHELVLVAGDGSTYVGEAIVRYSDGHRHLFRGDGNLAGFRWPDA